MIKTLLGQVKEFKLVSLLTPLGMLAEVIVENFIPLQMAVIIDSIGKNDLSTIYKNIRYNAFACIGRLNCRIYGRCMGS